ncbi:mucin-4 isoform X2 [Marmota marmota marmota]|uniref:mucin-4 isoform X2 n=1 Tax=Marmota marmota marmota TaxID=9994 RepID=UPI0020938673|nr:mucin-4 isoform X2 [Marmota marmota marmota]
MKGAHWRSFPWVLLCSFLLGPSDTNTIGSTSYHTWPTRTTEVSTKTASTDSRARNTGTTSQPGTASLPTATSGVSGTTGPEPSTVPTPSSSTQETSASPPPSPSPEGTTSTLSTSLSGNTLPVTISAETSPPGESTSLSSSSVSNTPTVTTEVPTTTASTDSTAENTGTTSQPGTASLPTATSGVSGTTGPEPSTVPIPSSSTQETFASPPPSPSPEETTSTLSTSLSGNTLPVTLSAEISLPGESTSLSSSSVSNTPTVTTEVPTTTASTDSTAENTGTTSQPGTASLPTATSGVSGTTGPEPSTVPIPSSSTQETSASPPPSPSPEGTTSTLSTSLTGNTLPVTLSAETSPPGESTSLSSSSVSNTPTVTTEVSTMTASTDSTAENTGATSQSGTSSHVTATSGVSGTTGPEPSTVPTPSSSTQETSASPPPSPSPEGTTSTLSTSLTGNTLPVTLSAETSPPGVSTSLSSSSVSNTPTVTTEVSTTIASTDSTAENTGTTSQPGTASLPTASSGVSGITGPEPLTVPIPSSSTQETPASPPPSPFPEGTTSTLLTSLSGNTLPVTLSAATSPQGAATSTAIPPPSKTSLTLTTSALSTSTSSRPTTSPRPVLVGQGVPLFPYGSSSGDLQLSIRTVDFTSQLFKLQIGFPLGFSLRDSLYFTDNGQIIFPKSDYQKFSYPNPPLGGFTGREPVAMVAPFWDDADFSGGRGTIFYQEYETLYDEYNPTVRQVETWIEKFTNTWSYKAKWTLKVTWVDAPAYPAQWTFGTNTYQAILSTDGSRSYALFLYQSNGMRWDLTQRWGNGVLMGFSSGDGYFENSPLMSRPLWEKYRPDRFLNSKLGLRGLQVYRLHGEERPNYRLKCLWWLKSQPQWPRWNWNQISCPCSWQQGRWDLRFQQVNIGWWGFRGRHLCSFSSWRGGVCCSYGPWGEFQEGFHVQSPWEIDKELETQNWCCRWNDKPSFCILYQQRRPRVSCARYTPPRPAWMFGDPHITTLDGANYTFNGLGDFLLVRGRDGNSSFLLQGRTAQTGSARATNFIAFAAQYNSSGLGPITVQWLLEREDTIHVLHNNQNVTFETNREDPEGPETFNTTGVLLTRNGSQVSASFDGTVAISVIALSNILHASSSLPEEYRNHTEGLLGVWNDNPEDDFMMPNGSAVPRNSSEETLFHYGMTWKVNGSGLLGKRIDHPPSNFTPVFYDQLINKSLNKLLISECNGERQCIYDSLATNNTDTGLHTKMLFRSYQQMNTSINEYPPFIDGCQEIEAYRGQTKRIQCTSNSQDVTFTLRDHNPDMNLFENGTLLWTPKVLEPFTLEILARKANVNLSSVLQPKTVVCFCSAESQCVYNQTRWVGNSSMEVASCKCNGETFGQYCERSRDPCDEQCFPGVQCHPGVGCGACPPHMTGDGHHCAAVEDTFACWNHSCPVNYCYNQGHCYVSQTLGCKPTCTCPPAFTDDRCLVAGNNFTPTVSRELPLRIIRLFLTEEQNASITDVNASVAYRLGTLDVRAFLWNSHVKQTSLPASASGKSIQHWLVTSEFQYRPRGPVIHFLNEQLREAVVEAFLFPVTSESWKSQEPRIDVVFHPISWEDVRDVMALNLSMLDDYFKCNGYKDYHLVYSPQSGVTCVSPCTLGYCQHGGQCQHLPNGPRCSCVPFSIYTPWGEHCEHLSMKLGAFFGILFGALGALLLLGIVAFVILHFWRSSRTRSSYPLDSES